MSNPRKPRRTSKPTTLKDVFTRLSPQNLDADDDTVQKLFNALSKQFEPQDILEEIWLHDIARITADIEIFRVVERSVQYHCLREKLGQLRRDATLSESQVETASRGIYQLTIGEAGASEMPGLSTLAVAGMLNELQIRKIAAIADVIQKLQRERDRIYAQFERKRRPLVIASVKTVEAQMSSPNPTGNLAE
jgi:hypothetical protein